jgi:hypothetical protein
LNSTKIAGLDGVFFTYLGDFSMKRASCSPQEISLKVGSLSAQKGIVHPLFSISKHARCWTLRMYSIQKKYLSAVLAAVVQLRPQKNFIQAKSTIHTLKNPSTQHWGRREPSVPRRAVGVCGAKVVQLPKTPPSRHDCPPACPATHLGFCEPDFVFFKEYPFATIRLS